MVDADGRPVRLLLTAGQASDMQAVSDLLAGLPAADVVADRGYDSNGVLELIQARGGQAHIPSCCRRVVKRTVAPEIYRQRNVVERFFCKLKQFRRVATRYEKRGENYRAMVVLAAITQWL